MDQEIAEANNELKLEDAHDGTLEQADNTIIPENTQEEFDLESKLEGTQESIAEQNDEDVLLNDSNRDVSQSLEDQSQNEIFSEKDILNNKDDDQMSHFFDDQDDLSMEKDVLIDSNRSSQKITADDQSAITVKGERTHDSDIIQDVDEFEEIQKRDTDSEIRSSVSETQQVPLKENLNTSKKSEDGEIVIDLSKNENDESQNKDIFDEIPTIEAEKVEQLSETSEYNDELHSAMAKAMNDNPDSKAVLVIKYDKNDEHPKIEHINVEDYKQNMYKRQDHQNKKSVEQILSDSIEGLSSSVTPAITQNSNNSLSVAEQLQKEMESKEPINQIHINKNQITETKAFKEFEHLSLQSALTGKKYSHQSPKSAHSNGLKISMRRPKHSGQSNREYKHTEDVHNASGTAAQQHYLKTYSTQSDALKMFATHDARKRASAKIPNGMPINVFLADLMGVSGIGEYKPSPNMIHYYGGLSEFHKHFADKATNQISFEDIDTLVGMLSDINGILHTVFKLLPKKDDAEKEKSQDKESNILDHAYDILKFYSRIRGFVNTVVFNRHLLIKDILFLKNKMSNLHTDEDDMLYFYALDVQYYKVKSRGAKYDFDPKINLFLNKIKGVASDFQIDVKKLLRSFFNFEKAIVFFDDDVRSLANGTNISNPLEALKTVDKVIMFLVRLIEIKIDLFKSLIDVKDSLKNLYKFRGEILEHLEGAEQLIHYYSLGNGEQIWNVFNIWSMLGMIMFWFVSRR